MGMIKRLGACVAIVIVGVFILLVTVVGFFRWLVTGKSLNDFAATIVYKLTKKTKDVI